MTPSTTPGLFTRRRAIGIGLPLVGAYVLAEYAPWLDPEGEARNLRRPFDRASGVSDRMRELVRYASLAANGHNAQAWHFTVVGDCIDIRPDYSRRLPVVDPMDRELWISLGCALENLLLAARAAGYRPDVAYPETDDVIRVRLAPDRPESGPLFEAVPRRRSNRAAYDGASASAKIVDQLLAVSEDGVSLRLVTGPGEMDTAIEYVRLATTAQYADRAYLDELVHWLRFTKRETCGSRDGLSTRMSGNPEVPRWLGRIFVAKTDPTQQADADARLLRSAAHTLVISSEADDRSNWVRTGQVHQRVALTMAAHGIDSALHNQPTEIAPLRAEFQRAMALGSFLPQLVMRFGYGPTAPQSLRRPVDEIITAGDEGAGR